MSFNKANYVEADNVFVLMTDEYRVSRNIRAQWYFNNLNKTIELPNKNDLNEFTEEIEIISIKNDDEDLNDLNLNKTKHYYISPKTKVIFLARRYRFVFVLDLSPSLASGDIQNNTIINEEVFTSLASCLRGLCTPFYVPGSKVLFTPEIFITILAHTSFYTGIKEVLIQGWRLTAENVEHFLNLVNDRLVNIISLIATITSQAIEQRIRIEEREINNKIDDFLNSSINQSDNVITMTTPDISMVNMYRYSLLAVHLLPENSTTNIVIISDGMLSLPNSAMLESMLAELRNNTIACSFIQVGSSPHPDSCLGYLPYTDLMQFISTATFGAYLPSCPPIDKIDNNRDYNIYHRAFLSWYFQKHLFYPLGDFNLDCNNLRVKFDNEWFVNNPYFFHNTDHKTKFSFEPSDLDLIRIKQTKNTIATKFTNMLSCRLREGFTIKSVNLGKNDTQIEVVLVLKWKYNVNIEYIMRSPWNRDNGEDELDENAEFSYELVIEGNYNFIHDVTCQVKRPIKSPFRLSAVKQFWSTIKSFAESDKILVLLNDFNRYPASPIPQSLISGVPLFYLPPKSNRPVLASKNTADQSFALYWRQICLLDQTNWQKWLHMHRINIILRHDPLPKYLHVPNAYGQFNQVQCRQSLISLSDLLKNYSSFVMLENQSYVKIINSEESEDGKPFFFIIRVVSNFPCIVLNLAFINGVSGYVRHKIVSELREEVEKCTTQFRNIKTTTIKTSPIKSTKQQIAFDLRNKENQNKFYTTNQQQQLNYNYDSQQQLNNIDKQDLEKQNKAFNENLDVEMPCCKILKKPIEKLLVRYEKPPIDYLSSVDQQFFSLSTAESNMELKKIFKKEMMATLSRYLHHERVIWNVENLSKETGKSISLSLLGKVLAEILKKRLDEGFNVAHNSGNGIVNLALEMKMAGECDKDCPNIVQYVLFPPHNNAKIGTQWELITEIWIEPQQGLSSKCEQSHKYLENKSYDAIASLDSYFIMNESNKNDSISLKNIMTNCTDWNISDQLNNNKIDTHWSSNKQNKLNNNDQIKRENFFQNYQHNKQPNQQLINRSKVMLNGIERIYDKPEIKDKYCINKNDISLHQFNNLTNNFDNFDKLSSSSLSNSIKNVSNIFKNNSRENISLSSLSPFDRSPYRKFCATSDKQPLSDTDKYASNDEYFNDKFKDELTNNYKKNKINYEFNSSNNLSSNDILLSKKQQKFNVDSIRRDSNNQIRKNSNTLDHALISLKKLNLSLPLKNENNLMDNSNRKLPSTINKNDIKETSKILQNSKYIYDCDNDKRKNSVNFLQNLKKPNSILATAQQQIHFDNNRSSIFNDREERAKTTNNQLNNKNVSKKILKFSSTTNIEKTTNKSDNLKNKLITNQSQILSKKLTNNLIDESLELNKLNTDLLKLRKDLNQFNDELLKVDIKIKNDNQLKRDILVTNQQTIDKINRNDNNAKRINNQNEINTNEIDTNEIYNIEKIKQQQLQSPPNQLTDSTFIDYNPINLKLNSKLVHLIRHSELDQKSSLLLNLVQENHCGIILCRGQSTIVNAQCSIGYYIGAITLNSTAQQLLTIGDLVLEINSIPLHSNMITMNLDKVTNLMNSYFNLNRYLQLRIVSRALLMNQFRQFDSSNVNDKFNNDSIRTIVVNAQKQKLSTSKYSFGLTISGGSEYGLGIFVSNVDRGSLSEQSGLKRGDLIITLNGHDFLNLTHDHAALLIRNNSILILRVRNVGFVPISALLLDQNDDTTKFRCNSAIELTDYSRVNLRKQQQQNPLNKLPIELINDELKIHGLLNRNEIKDYLINKYGLINESNRMKRQINYLIDDYEKLDDNYQSQNLLFNNLIKNDYFYSDKQDDLLNQVPSSIKFNNLKNMPLSSKLNNLINNNDNLLSNKLSSLPDSSLLNTSSSLPNSSLSNSLLNSSPLQNVSLHSTNDLSQYLINKSEFNDNFLDNKLKKELQLDEQINLLLNNNDRFDFNFYKNEYLSKNISLNLFVYSISCLMDTPEKRKIFKYLRPLIPKTDLLRYDQLISIYDHQQNYQLSNEDEPLNFNKLYRSNSYDDNLMDREHWINTSYFNKNQNFGSIDNYLHNPQVQSNRFNSNYHHLLNSRNNSFPLLNQLPSQFPKQSGSLINSMSPYHYNQTTDLNNIQNNPSITSSASPYLNSFLQNRITTGDNFTTTKSNSLNNNSVYHSLNQPIHTVDQTNLTDSYSSHLNNIPYTNNVQTTYTNNYHPSINNYNNLPNNVNNLHNNFLNFNEQNQLTPECDSMMNYQSQNLIANHNMVKRHRSLPADSFQREFNYYPNKHFVDPNHQRSSSFKLPPRRLYESGGDCFRVRISKNKPIFGIAIEGGINVPNQTLPRIISIHEDGSAFENGRLKVGHIILEINGVKTENLTHSEIARLLAHSYYTNQDNFIELMIKEEQTDAKRNSLLMLNNNYG